jgi:uncharacterized OB-fold protein
MIEKNPSGYKCQNCGKIHYPKHGRCLKCKYLFFDEINLPNEGTLITYTMLKAPPTGINKHSLYLGILDLGEVRYTGQIEVEDISKLSTGMKLKATWKKVRTIDNKDYLGFVWVPV